VRDTWASKIINELIHTFEYALDFVTKSVADLSEEEMVQQPHAVPNHGTWTLGHLIVSCQGIATELGAVQWLPDDWESMFGYGSKPLSDLSLYPNKSEMLSHIADAASRLCQLLLETDESDLRRSLPDETLPTKRHLLVQVVVAHTAYHAGQLAVWRKAIGKPSVSVFI
jgi:uncharacterized damage-inducible protein DinB